MSSSLLLAFQKPGVLSAILTKGFKLLPNSLTFSHSRHRCDASANFLLPVAHKLFRPWTFNHEHTAPNIHRGLPAQSYLLAAKFFHCNSSVDLFLVYVFYTASIFGLGLVPYTPQYLRGPTSLGRIGGKAVSSAMAHGRLHIPRFPLDTTHRKMWDTDKRIYYNITFRIYCKSQRDNR